MTRDAGADRTRGIQMMILGAVVAVLAPLGGFLGGSIVGPAREMGDFDAMFVWMFVGLLVGGIGAVLVLLGLLRWSRATRQDAVSPPRTPPA
jgi:hypothetical protein